MVLSTLLLDPLSDPVMRQVRSSSRSTLSAFLVDNDKFAGRLRATRRHPELKDNTE